MGKLIKKLTTRGKSGARKIIGDVETNVMAAVGRKTVRGKVSAAKKVGKKAVKAGLVAGAMAAAGVVVRELRKPREG